MLSHICLSNSTAKRIASLLCTHVYVFRPMLLLQAGSTHLMWVSSTITKMVDKVWIIRSSRKNVLFYFYIIRQKDMFLLLLLEPTNFSFSCLIEQSHYLLLLRLEKSQPRPNLFHNINTICFTLVLTSGNEKQHHGSQIKYSLF